MVRLAWIIYPGFAAWEFRFNTVFHENGVDITSLESDSTVYSLDPKQPVKINDISVDISVQGNSIDGG